MSHRPPRPALTPMRKGLDCIVLALPAVVIIFVCWLVWPEHDRVREKFDMVSADWSRADVEMVLGGPTATNENDEGLILFYHGLGGIGNVIVDPETERVVRRQWFPVEQQTPLARLMRWADATATR